MAMPCITPTCKNLIPTQYRTTMLAPIHVSMRPMRSRRLTTTVLVVLVVCAGLVQAQEPVAPSTGGTEGSKYVTQKVQVKGRPLKGLVAPFAGGSFKGDSDRLDPPQPVYGVSVGFWDDIPVGVEAEIAHFPGFFPPQHPDHLHHATGGLTTLMANALVGATIGDSNGNGFRPYVSIGSGLFRIPKEPNGRLDIQRNAFGLGVGGGAIIFFTGRLGVRGDLRFLQEFQEAVSGEEPPGCCHPNRIEFRPFRFARGVMGLVLRF